MKPVTVYNLEAQKVKELELNPNAFDVRINHDLVHQSISAQLANSRQVIAHTKGRAEVRGGGKKPWRQKGTGRARHGSSRSPIWRGGGITFGPTNMANYSKRINKKMKKKALLMGLSSKVQEKAVTFIDSVDLAEIKTKAIKQILEKFGFTGKKVLIVLPEKNEKVNLSVRNIPGIRTILADSLNIIDVLDNEVMFVLIDSISKIEKMYLK